MNVSNFGLDLEPMVNQMFFSLSLSFLGLQSAWCIVFVCRMWWTWIQHKQFTSTASSSTRRNTKQRFFITKTAYLSVEMNAHNLLYIILLVKQNHLPKEALNAYLFNSQSCASMFRNARSLSGTFSTIINFTVADFLRRSQKLSILLGIKCDQLLGQDHNNSLLFPVHHKHNHDDNLASLQKLEDIDQMDIEETISDAFEQALQLTQRLEISELLKKYDVFDMNLLSKYVFRQLNSSSKMFDYSTQTTHNHDDSDSDEFDLEDEEDEDTDDNLVDDQQDNNYVFADQEDDDVDDDNNITSIKANFNGMRICEKIQTHQQDSYFKIKVNGVQKFMHKQSASWLLTEKNIKLSNDRLSRVIQTSRKDNEDSF